MRSPSCSCWLRSFNHAEQIFLPYFIEIEKDNATAKEQSSEPEGLEVGLVCLRTFGKHLNATFVVNDYVFVRRQERR